MLLSCLCTFSIISVLPLSICLPSLVRFLLSLCHLYSMIGFRSDGILSGNMVVDLVEHVITRTLVTTTSDVDLLITGVDGKSIKYLNHVD